MNLSKKELLITLEEIKNENNINIDKYKKDI